MKSIAEIRAARQRLVAKAALQRRDAGMHYSALERPAGVVARGLDIVDWLRKRPLIVGIATAALVAIRPRGTLKLAGQGLFAWRAMRTVREFLKAARITS